MRVNESITQAADYSHQLDEKRKHHNSVKEAEIEKLKQIYDQKIAETSELGEEKYVSALKRNEERIIGATKDYEEKLNSYKENLSQTQKNIAQEELALKNEHEEKMRSARSQNINNIHDQFRNAKESQEAVESQIDNTVKLIADKSRAEKNHLERNAQFELNALSTEYNHKEINNEKNFRAQVEANIKAHEEEVRLQRDELKTSMSKTMQQGKRLEQEKVQVQKDELTFLENHQKEMISQKDADFKVRYENIVKEHDATIAEIKSHLEHDIRKMISDTSAQKRMIANKKDDKFYRIETLHPTVQETAKAYFVSLKVPEHEKESVHLSVHGREVKMTMTRKYTESLKEEDGTINKSTKNELYSKEFSSKDILNPKLMTQKYEDGVLTYKIQKL
ncbi:MAG: hypothetical protein KBD76_00925 [Bacteriovorax sp.]|nr:hypothetical protein [Bacteriovorax sp.]